MIYEKALIVALLYAIPVKSQPVVPNFTTGHSVAPQIQQPQSVRLLLLQIILVILMSTLLLDWESQPMDQSLQIQRMLQGQ